MLDRLRRALAANAASHDCSEQHDCADPQLLHRDMVHIDPLSWLTPVEFVTDELPAIG